MSTGDTPSRTLPMKQLHLADWNPQTVLKALADTFPEHITLYPDGLISQKRERARITVRSPHPFALNSSPTPRFFCFAPALSSDAGISSLVKSYLAKGGITVSEVRITPAGSVSLSSTPSLSQDSLYLPEIHGARAASELADFLGSSELTTSLRTLAGKKAYQLHALTESGLLKTRSLDLKWTANGISVSIDVPVMVLEHGDTKIALLDQSPADRYLMSLVALKGYICFKLLTY